MATIRVTEQDGKRRFFVQCFEPLTKTLLRDPYDRERLEIAVAATPGARAHQLAHEHVPSPSGYGDERFDFALEINHSNVVALWAAGFAWDESALKIVAPFPHPRTALDTIRETMTLLWKRKQQTFVEMLQDFHEASGAEPSK